MKAIPNWNSEGKIICEHCKDRLAQIRKYSLCARCYQQNRNSSHQIMKTSSAIFLERTENLYSKDINLAPQTEKKYQHRSEILFGQLHPTFHYQPAIFRLGKTSYAPDFYDPIHNEFYEVIGSRQRFEQLKEKIRKFREAFPMVKLFLCCGDGKPYNARKDYQLIGTPENKTLFS